MRQLLVGEGCGMFPHSVKLAKSARVLIVEDEVLLRIDVSDHLREVGFEVIESDTADGAWKYLANGKVDLVFADIETPGSLDGLQLAQLILAQFPSLPVILTSGRNAAEIAAQFGVFIPKPYRPEAVALNIIEALGLEKLEG